MTDLAWDLVEDLREIVRLFDPVSISGRPSGVVPYDNDSRLPPTPLLCTQCCLLSVHFFLPLFLYNSQYLLLLHYR